MNTLSWRFRTEYLIPEGARGEARIYGDFPGCRLLGSPCTIRTEKQADGWDGATDATGFPGVFAHGGRAIHVSGRDVFGRKSGLGFIRGLARYSVDWLGSKDHPSGLGCHEPEAATIISFDGAHNTPERCYDLGFWGECRYIFTLAGVLCWARTVNEGKAFKPVDILKWIDAQKKRPLPLNDPLHIAVLRRLLDGSVDIRKNGLKHTLCRDGRWGYIWTPTE